MAFGERSKRVYREAKTRQDRSETPPNAMETQVIHTTRKCKPIFFIFPPYFVLSLYSHTNSYNNAITQCHVDSSQRSLAYLCYEGNFVKGRKTFPQFINMQAFLAHLKLLLQCFQLLDFLQQCIGRNEIGRHYLPHCFSNIKCVGSLSNNFGSLSITSGDWRDIHLITFRVFHSYSSCGFASI